MYLKTNVFNVRSVEKIQKAKIQEMRRIITKTNVLIKSVVRDCKKLQDQEASELK